MERVKVRWSQLGKDARTLRRNEKRWWKVFQRRSHKAAPGRRVPWNPVSTTAAKRLLRGKTPDSFYESFILGRS